MTTAEGAGSYPSVLSSTLNTVPALAPALSRSDQLQPPVLLAAKIVCLVDGQMASIMLVAFVAALRVRPCRADG